MVKEKKRKEQTRRYNRVRSAEGRGEEEGGC